MNSDSSGNHISVTQHDRIEGSARAMRKYAAHRPADSGVAQPYY